MLPCRLFKRFCHFWLHFSLSYLNVKTDKNSLSELNLLWHRMNTLPEGSNHWAIPHCIVHGLPHHDHPHVQQLKCVPVSLGSEEKKIPPQSTDLEGMLSYIPKISLVIIQHHASPQQKKGADLNWWFWFKVLNLKFWFYHFAQYLDSIHFAKNSLSFMPHMFLSLNRYSCKLQLDWCMEAHNSSFIYVMLLVWE